MTQINTPNDGKNGYVAMYNGRQVDVWADTSFQATERARNYFKPPKSKRHLVHVVLAEQNGQQVTHLPLI
jgi:hypothetical protein